VSSAQFQSLSLNLWRLRKLTRLGSPQGERGGKKRAEASPWQAQEQIFSEGRAINRQSDAMIFFDCMGIGAAFLGLYYLIKANIRHRHKLELQERASMAAVLLAMISVLALAASCVGAMK